MSECSEAKEIYNKWIKYNNIPSDLIERCYSFTLKLHGLYIPNQVFHHSSVFNTFKFSEDEKIYIIIFDLDNKILASKQDNNIYRKLGKIVDNNDIFVDILHGKFYGACIENDDNKSFDDFIYDEYNTTIENIIIN